MSRWWLVAAAAACMTMLAFRLAAPSDIFENAQARPCAHIVDVAVHGNWLMQRDPGGVLATKPPMYPWLGAVIVKALGGRTSEWVFKAPLWLAYLGTAVLIVDLGRRSVPGPVGLIVGALAAAMWSANHHTFKLAYTARTDMLLTGFILLAVCAVLRQRQRWLAQQPACRLDIALFWIAIALGVLTKGPAALLPVGLWLLLVGHDRGWRHVRPNWQIAGAAVMLGLAAAWLIPTLRAYPQWMDNINREVIERVSGTGTGARRTDPFYVIPYYLMTRTLPWSLVFAAAAVCWLASRSRSVAIMSSSLSDAADDGTGRPTIGWAFTWVALVLAVFMISKGRRADYLLPAYPPMMIAAAWGVVMAQRHSGLLRGLVHAIVGGAGIIAMLAAAGTPWLPRPVPLDLGPWPHDVEPSYAAVYWLGALLMFGAGAAGLWWTHRTRYARAAMAVCFAVIAAAAVFHTSFAPIKTDRRSEYAHTVVDIARQAGAATGLPVVCHEIGDHGSEIIPALLGRSDPWDRRALRHLDDQGAVLVVGVAAWARMAEAYADRAVILAQTPATSYRHGVLGFLVVRVDPLPPPSSLASE